MSVHGEPGGVLRAWGRFMALCSDSPGMGWVCLFQLYLRGLVSLLRASACAVGLSHSTCRGEISELAFCHLDNMKDVFPKVQKHMRFPCLCSTSCDYHTCGA